MTTCEECKRFGYTRTNQESNPCALCGELRCEDHMIWVPSHEIEKPFEEAEAIAELMKYGKVGGYYGFCGGSSHIPRGLPIRHGKEKEGGKVVHAILDHEKKPGLECFRMWEIGAIEDGFETAWEVKRYALSCSLAPVMALIANMYQTGREPSSFLENLYRSAFTTFANKKSVFFLEDWNNFTKSVGSNPTKEELFNYTCSRCAVIPCMNRQAHFHDSKLFKKLVKVPETLEQ
ncbi:MAG: hypothetical protein IH631_01735 [Candidatus Thorarchaeota archaeon]|nr:hypothetical protein [Candidatus Thorarchaeota archaeon]